LPNTVQNGFSFTKEAILQNDDSFFLTTDDSLTTRPECIMRVFI
jgi:hypothetical protein